MPITTTTATKAMSLAALLAVATAGFAADDGKIDWSSKTTWASKAEGWKLELGVKLDALAFYHDVDKARSEDAVLRSFSSLPSISSTSNASTYYSILTTAGSTYGAVERASADGIELDDAEIWVRGSAYGNIVFGIRLEAAKSDERAQIDNWYAGVNKIPFVGTAVIGEVNLPWFDDGQFYDNSVPFLFFGDRKITGFRANNEFKTEGGMALGYTAVAGQAAGTTEYGSVDRNYDLGLSLWIEPVATDVHGLKFQLDLYSHNPSTTAFGAYSDVWGGTGAPTLKKGTALLPLGFGVHADEVQQFILSGSYVRGAFGIGAQYYYAKTKAADLGYVVGASQITELLGNTGVVSFSEYHDGTFSGYSVNAAYTITGEAQKHGGGGIKPKANFAWDGSGYGAFEVVARYSAVDLTENTRDAVRIPTAASAVTSAILFNATNVEEGGEIEVLDAGINWYLNPSMLISFQYSRAETEVASGAITSTSAGGAIANAGADISGLTSLAGGTINNTTLRSLANYYAASSVKNEYVDDSFFMEVMVKF